MGGMKKHVGAGSKRNGSRSVKWIVVTGGVLSGLGKGVAAASIGRLLASNYKIVPVKCDGYLNVDPGTMNPIEHGEVFVLDDGGEVDMDFGHYERYLGVTCKWEWNLTMGKVYDKVRKKERRGDYLGKTVQLIPHVTNLVKDWWKELAKEEEADVMIVEVGGTVGDIENELYIEAARQLKEDVGSENIMYVHLTYVPIPSHVNEPKTKPTQQSMNLLRARGIQPDVLLCRCAEMLDDKSRGKIAVFGGIPKEHVITAVDVDTVYEIPLFFEQQGLGTIVAERLGLALEHDKDWEQLVQKMLTSQDELNIAICGKYTALEDSYASVVEALRHSSAHHDVTVKVHWLDTSDDKLMADLDAYMKKIHGVIVPGGFGGRGVEGKIQVVQYCREHNTPYLGICYGLQMAVIDHARNICGMRDANTTENEKPKDPVIDILPDQKGVTEKGGTMRLGAYPAILKAGTVIHELYTAGRMLGKDDTVSERHRHRYEVNPGYHATLLKGAPNGSGNGGLVFCGMSPDGTLVEFLERSKDAHPYFVATQAHPELKSSLKRPAPLFMGLVGAAAKRKRT